MVISEDADTSVELCLVRIMAFTQWVWACTWVRNLDEEAEAEPAWDEDSSFDNEGSWRREVPLPRLMLRSHAQMRPSRPPEYL